MERTVMVAGKAHPLSEITRSVRVRPVEAGEEARWKALIREHHLLLTG